MKEIYVLMFPGMVYFWVFYIGRDPLEEIFHERDANTMHRILAAPVTLQQFLLSKLIRCFLLCAVVQLLLFLASAVLFGISWGSPLLLMPVVLVCSLSATGLLALVYAVAGTREQADAICHVVVITCGFVGGSLYPFEGLPDFLQAIGRFAPNHWAVLAIQTTADSGPLTNLAQPMIILTAIGLAGTIVALYLFHRRLAAGGEQ